ncbi:hypothetical protein PG994_004001 [Apiospora phragmitis]|uniref:Lysine-specific metallo-endopeptidase domain-containing protein n=1 Tax=Apiospora phragmitis TaxID=2905665 RepID=A0ABR1W3I3_9PEZI
MVAQPGYLAVSTCYIHDTTIYRIRSAHSAAEIMKIVLLALSASLVTGNILHRPEWKLVARNGQQLTNPDNEPDWVDQVTGTKTPKSRVLSGVGPEEADNRLFDWDESCSDEKQRKKILDAFTNMHQLLEWTSTHLGQLQEGLPNPVDPSKTNDENRKYIFDKDPAYAQMFLGHDNRIQYVKETFDLVKGESKKKAGERGGNKPGALRLICSHEKNEVMYHNMKDPLCGFEKSSSITFCPKFFDNHEFPNIDALAGLNEPTLDKVDCAERILLHEFMHLYWIRNMPGGERDYTGYQDAAENAEKSKWGGAKKTPDN